MNDTQNMLASARTLIEDPANWARDYLALDGEGNAVWPTVDRAARFCALGACVRVVISAKTRFSRVEAYLLAAVIEKGGVGVGAYNDTHTHEEVLALFDRAIELAADTQGATQPTEKCNEQPT